MSRFCNCCSTDAQWWAQHIDPDGIGFEDSPETAVAVARESFGEELAGISDEDLEAAFSDYKERYAKGGDSYGTQTD